MEYSARIIACSFVPKVESKRKRENDKQKEKGNVQQMQKMFPVFLKTSIHLVHSIFPIFSRRLLVSAGNIQFKFMFKVL